MEDDFVPSGMILLSQEDLNILVCKVKMYEQFLHDINLYASVTMNGNAMTQLIDNACRWSYAHRVGNGEFTDEEQEHLVFLAFQRLLTVDL